MRRWVCPLCGNGRLCPERPRADDARQFCLACSGKTSIGASYPKLVRRTCPSLDLERTARADAKAKLDAQWTVAGVDVRRAVKTCWAALLPSIRERESTRLLNTPACNCQPVGVQHQAGCFMRGWLLANPPINLLQPHVSLHVGTRHVYSAGRLDEHGNWQVPEPAVRVHFNRKADRSWVWVRVLYNLSFLGGTGNLTAITAMVAAAAKKLWGVRRLQEGNTLRGLCAELDRWFAKREGAEHATASE